MKGDTTHQTYIPDISNAICARDHKGARPEADQGAPLVAHSLRGEGFDASEDGTGRGTPLVPVPAAVQFCHECGEFHEGHTCPLCGTGDTSVPASDVPQYGPVAIRTAQTSANGHGVAEGVTHTLGGAQGQAVAFQSKASASQSMNPAEVTPSIDVGKSDGLAVQFATQVRRLTPRECERLQGFPDDYTLITYRGKLAADGPRYKALGNSMAVPVMRWIGERIEQVQAIMAANDNRPQPANDNKPTK